MKNCLVLILLLANSIPFYAQKESETISTEAYDFEGWTHDWVETPGEAVIFADACKLRSQPTSGSEMLAKLLIGNKVKVLKVSDVDTTINGIQSKWIQVESGKKKGYVWGGLLTNQSLKISDTTSAVWGLTKIVKGNDTIHDKYYASIRIFSRKQVRKQLEFEVTHGDQPAHAELRMIKKPLIDGIECVFVYYTLSEACGVAWSEHYILETGSQLRYLDVGYGVGEAGLFHSSVKWIFPTQEMNEDYTISYYYKPEKNQVLKVDFHDEYDENCIWTEHTTVESFEWKDGVLVPFCRE